MLKVSAPSPTRINGKNACSLSLLKVEEEGRYSDFSFQILSLLGAWAIIIRILPYADSGQDNKKRNCRK